LVDRHQRAGIAAAVYIVAYSAFGIPIIVEGQIATRIGNVPAVLCYSGVAILLALVSLIAQMRIARRP
jgi:hypothetical protein